MYSMDIYYRYRMASRCHMAWRHSTKREGCSPDTVSHTAPDCRTLFILYLESGAYVHALPLIGSNSQCVVASNQNSMAEGASLLAKTQHVWG